MEGRFVKWCLLLAASIAALAACLILLNQLGLSGWRRFVVLIPVLLVLRFGIQHFLAKGRRDD